MEYIIEALVHWLLTESPDFGKSGLLKLPESLSCDPEIRFGDLESAGISVNSLTALTSRKVV